jgi:GT2 family glycosyltransferase
MAPDNSSSLPELAITVVLFHSDLEQFEELLASVAKSLRNAKLPAVTMICVDNSVDADYAQGGRAICDRWQGAAGLSIEWISTAVNGGYGAGHNFGLRRVSSRFHLILNPDVALDERAISEALQLLNRHSEVVLLAPVGADAEGQPEYLAKAFPSVWVLALRAFAPGWLLRLTAKGLDRYEMRQLDQTQDTRVIELASGCCMWVRRDALDRVGGFNESFFLYFEDYDLSMRLQQLGELIESQRVRIIHHGGDAARKGWRHIGWFAAGAIRFFNRWGWRWFG